MDLERRKYFEEQLAMFESPGWKHFVGQVNEIMETLNSVDGIGTLESLYEHKGEIKNLRWILAWPKMVREAYEEQEE